MRAAGSQVYHGHRCQPLVTRGSSPARTGCQHGAAGCRTPLSLAATSRLNDRDDSYAQEPVKNATFERRARRARREILRNYRSTVSAASAVNVICSHALMASLLMLGNRHPDAVASRV